MTNLAPYEFVSLVDEHGNARSDFAELQPPPRVWTDDEVTRIREEAETAGYARGSEDARQSNEARIAAALENLAGQAGGLRGEMARIEEEITRDAVNLTRLLAGKIAGEALHNDPLGVVDPVIETTLKQMTGPHLLNITVHDILKPAITFRVSQLAERTGFEGGVRVSGGADHMADCRIEWATGGIERNQEALLDDIDKCLATHGYEVKATYDRRTGTAAPDNLEFNFESADSGPRRPTEMGM